MIVREANIPGGSVKVFDDGSIELQTAAGTRWFRSFAELERSLRASNGLQPHQGAEKPETPGAAAVTFAAE